MALHLRAYFLPTVLVVFNCPAQQPPAVVEEAVSPAYPSAAVEGRISGTVIVTARVAENGKVSEATIAKGQPLLWQASLEAARLWHFRAKQRIREVKLTFSFKLMPKNTPEPVLGAVFRPPYTVEVRKIAADPVIHYANKMSDLAGQTVP
jgi:TonB family protein